MVYSLWATLASSPHKPNDLGSPRRLTDLLYSHLFPMRKRRPEQDGKKEQGGGRKSGLSHTWNQLEEAAKRADYCLDRSVGSFNDKPELPVQKTRHQKLSLASLTQVL